MTRTELIIQLLKVAIGLAFGAYFVWWSLEVLDRLAPEDQVRAAVIDARPMQRVFGEELAATVAPCCPLARGAVRPVSPLQRPLQRKTPRARARTPGCHRHWVLPLGSKRTPASS
jgi:hypothetical protein